MKKIITFTILLIIACGAYFYWELDINKLNTQFVIFDKEYRLSEKKPELWTDINSISKEAKWAIVVSEDWAFFDHKGIDFNQLSVVIKESVEEKELTRGASTITQQVIKNAFLSNEKSLIRKFKEMIAAYRLEKMISKEKILEQYLNLIELGDGVYGIGAASRYYFDKKPLELNAKEGAFLAMLLPSPKKYNISFKNKKLTEYASKTIAKIMVKLRQARVITEQRRLELSESPFSWEVEYVNDSYF